jgi:hypothetical protein
MASYRVMIATAAAPTVFIAELPFESLSFTEVLNSSGTCTVQVPLKSYLTDTATVAVGSTVLWVERDGVLVFGGIVWTMSGETHGLTATLSAGDFHTYYARRVVRTTQSWTATEQLDIARGLVDYANGETDALTIVGTAGTNSSGVTRDRSYPAWESKNIASALEQLAAVNNGFDFKYELSYTAGVPTVEFVCTTSNTGTATNIVFDLDSCIEQLMFNLDGSQIATQVDVLGVGEGPEMPIGTATQAGSAFALSQHVRSSDASVQATLTATAERQLAMRRGRLNSISAIIRSDVEPSFEDYSVGDIVEVRADVGLLSINDDFRITQRSVSFGSNQETVVVELVDSAAFAAI